MTTLTAPGPVQLTPDMRSALVRSVIVHGLVVIGIALAFASQGRRIAEQETRVLEDLELKAKELAAQEEQEQADLAKELTLDQVRMTMTEILHDTVSPQDLEELLASMDADLAALFADFDTGDWEALDDQALNELLAEGLDLLAQRQRDLLAAALVAQIRKHVRDTVVPDLETEIEARLRTQVGEAAAKVAQDALNKAKRDKRLAEDAAIPAAKIAADAIIAKTHEALQQAITDELVPKATQRVMDAFSEEIKKLPVDSEQLGKLIEEDIRKAAAEELAGTDPSAQPAALDLKRRNHLADAQALQQAADDATATSDLFNALRERQERIRADAPDDSPGKEPLQGVLVTDIKQALDQAQQMLTDANRVAWDDRGIKEARRELSNSKALAAAQTAERELRSGKAQDAAASMQRDEVELAKTAAALAVAADSLAAQAKAASEQPVSPDPSAEAVAAGETAAGAAAQTVADDVPKQVAAAGEKTRISGVLGDAGRLAAIAELGQRIGEAQAKMADGRDIGGPSLLPGAGILGGQLPGQGLGLRPGMGGSLALGRFNRRAYEAFVKDLQNRMNPDNVYGGVAETEGLTTLHAGSLAERPARVWIDEGQRSLLEHLRKPVDGAPERKIPDPQFTTKAWGAAAMMTKAPNIDGDLSDWGDLTHPLELHWEARNANEQVDSGISVYMRWNSQGIFAAYAVADTTGIHPPPASGPWDGDAFEWWLDLDNSRRDDSGKSDTAHQFILNPFGVQGAADRRFFEYTHGQRQMRPGLHDLAGKGFAAAKMIDGGYSVEVYIQSAALSKPVLLPGQILAMNVSVNLGPYPATPEYLWSSAKAIGTFMKPDTWGDVVLLGADAELKTVDPTGDWSTPLEWIVPGTPVGIEIADADMNLRSDRPDRIAATAAVANHDARLLLVLNETGPDTGVFRASFDTAPFLPGPSEATLPIRSGQILEFAYQDPRAAYGESNRLVKSWLPVAWPVRRLAAP